MIVFQVIYRSFLPVQRSQLSLFKQECEVVTNQVFVYLKSKFVVILQFWCELTMDKRALAEIFNDRFRQVLEASPLGKNKFLKATGIDRSALSQFLSTDIDRLPRAETLRKIAETSGVSVDWLLNLENAPEGRQEVSSSVQIERAQSEDGSTPLHRWQMEAVGSKLRYVPSTLPDMLSLSAIDDRQKLEIDARGGGVENVLEGVSPDDLDVEIAMPVQTIQDLATQTGLWRNASADLCDRQLKHMINICEESYPRIRLHLYDGSQIFAAPFTVFGRQRAVLYIGGAYLVITNQEQVREFTKKFDNLVRSALIGPDKVHEYLAELLNSSS